ncbi:hypothetical protein CDL12_30043 [Handroanthus impetiginosus]|uniref:Uncharacterized protein n=1 Tax=Handroanthus impetiginosus TaxID=429701 RepID=A0A2G9FX63_9LAMI|nr:hypothetical protein CDL12_30043 [Handroanthus impetiginosus]
MQTIKETAANAAASAKSGMEKTKAAFQVETMSADNPTEKEMATEKKEEKMNQAETDKQGAHEQNAATKEEVGSGESYSYSTTGEAGKPSGEPAGQVTEGTIKSHPIGRATGMGRPTTAHNAHVGAAANKGYGTGGAYSG